MAGIYELPTVKDIEKMNKAALIKTLKDLIEPIGTQGLNTDSKEEENVTALLKEVHQQNREK